jgi:Mor family transcriptional regulator
MRKPRLFDVPLALAALLCLLPGAAAATNVPPLVKNLAVWYDASSSSTITTATNPLITTWNDLSGNGVNLSQATSADEPAYLTNSINGLGTVKFNGAGPDYMVGSLSAAPGNGAQHTIFVVGSGAAGFSGAFLGYSGAASSNSNSAVGTAPGTSTSAAWWFGGWGQDTAYSGGTNNGSAHLFTKIFNGSTITGDFDGSAIFSISGTYNLTDAHVYVGVQDAALDQPLGGYIGEIVIYNVALSQTNYQIVEGYLACKWGLQGNLPSGHPYKSSCPSGTPTTFSPSISGLAAWYDASNTGSITTASNPLVTTWNDRSGNGVTLSQATSGNQPAYLNSGIDGLPALQFTKTAPDYMIGSLAAAPGSGAPHTMFVVGSGVTTYAGAFAAYSAAASTNANSVVGLAPAGTFNAWWFGGYGQDNAYSGGTNDGFPHLFTKVFNGSTITGDYDGSAVFSMSATYNLTDAHVYVGVQNTNHDQPLQGNIGEVIMYSGALSSSEYQYIEGYLACKWGLQGNLPSGHPYKSTCPSGTASLTLSTAVSPTGAQVPGTNLTYTTTYTNGGGILNYGPVFTAPIPANTYFKVGSVSSNQSTTGLAAPAVTYSNNGGTSYAYTPASGGGGAPSGYDANVTNVEWTFSGALGCGSVNNSGTTTFIAQIK